MKSSSILVLTLLMVLGVFLAYCGEPARQNKLETTTPEMTVQGDYLNLGAQIAVATRDALGKQLVQAIGTLGTAGAIEFCNTRAIPITDSLALFYSARVKRVSDKARNPGNQANESELIILQEWKDMSRKGDSISGRIIERDRKMIGYYPIKTNAMCLQCHGEPGKDITPEILAVLEKNYPDDKATGYGVDQLRGMFVVEMDKK